MSYPITGPAAYPISTAFGPTGTFANTDQNNTNAVANYAWGAADAAPAGVRAATTGAETYTIVSGSVTTINGTTIDGVSVAVNDLILVKDAPAASGVGSPLSSQPANGLYYVTAVATNITVARAATMSPASAQANPAGRIVFVRPGGTVNASTMWEVKIPFGIAPFIWGTTALTWGNYLTDVTITNIDGVTIGATTPSPSITANELILEPSGGSGVLLSGTSKPWINWGGGAYYHGNLSGGSGYVNYIAYGDQVNYTGTGEFIGLEVFDAVSAPAVGSRMAIFGQVSVSSAGTNTVTQATYIGVGGRAANSANLGGTSPALTDSIGSLFGGWFQADLTTGATNQAYLFGVEIDVSVASGANVATKVGLLVSIASTDRNRGTTEDAAIQILATTGLGATVTWQNGIRFGTNAGTPLGGAWPFDNTSTIMSAATAGIAGNPANIGIDFSNVTFSGPAFKTGAAPIALSEMVSAPSGIAGEGQLYAASDGSLHYLSPGGTDTQIAPA